MKKIRFAIIGCGRIAQRHAEHITNSGVLQAVCDVVFSKAQALGEKYGAKPYQNLEDLLNEERGVDIVAICTPNGLHAEHTIKALNAGFNVLCEHKGFTESHQIVVDISKNGGGRKIADNYENSNIIINKNLLPWDKLEKTGNPSGIRIGTQEVTRVGMKESEMKQIAELMKRLALDGEKPEKVRGDVIELKKNFNKVRYCFDNP